MLPTIKLDDENYIEIFEKSRKMIPKVYPEWTNYNETDPGITLLELFSWLKEMQQFYIDQIGDDNYQMYLKILGIKKKRKESATSLIQVKNSNINKILKGTKFKAGNIIFETVANETIEKNRIVGCMVENYDGQIEYHDEMINSGSEMNIPAFGIKPEKDDKMYLYFDKPLEKGTEHKIYIEIFDEYEVNRNPFGDKFYPLSTIDVEYLTENGYRKFENVKDETHGFLNGGIWTIAPLEDMKEENGRYTIRFVLNKSEYDVVPVIKKLNLNIFNIVQRDTKCNYEILELDENRCLYFENYMSANSKMLFFAENFEKGSYELIEKYEVTKENGKVSVEFSEAYEKVLAVLDVEGVNEVKAFETNGFPFQQYSINDELLLYDGFDILIKEKYDNLYHKWEKVDNFHCSTPEDRHYVFDENRGFILFGDAEKGMAPEGDVLIIKYILSSGTNGNIKKNRIENLNENDMFIEATNCFDISNGTNAENIEEAFERFGREQNEVDRGITFRDYEALISNTPGLRIKKVKAISELNRHKKLALEREEKRYTDSTKNNEISVVVQPYSYEEKAKLSEAYYKNINEMIDKKRMLGTKVNIISPEYYGVTIFLEVNIYPHYLNAKEQIENVINNYFENVVSEFGSAIIFNDIYGRIDALKCVSDIKAFSIDVNGKNVIHSKNEDILIPENGQLYLKSVDYVIGVTDY